MSQKSRTEYLPNCPVVLPRQQRRHGCPNRAQPSQEDREKEGRKHQAKKKNEGDPNIIKSPSDHKEYRYIKLKNDLNVLLISDLTVDDCNSSETSEDEEVMSSETDEEEHNGGGKDSSPEDDEEKDGEDLAEEYDGAGEDEGAASDGTGEIDTRKRGQRVNDPEEFEELVKKEDAKKMSSTEKQSAAALAICIGSFCDPDDLPGLAHFLEHMVFMGSEKFPDENGFDTFLKKHGGTDNASTDTERTVFQFDIQKKYFKEALDRWAQFFIHPLMIKDAIHREVEAVDSGNAETLKHLPMKKKTDTYGRLRDFRKRHYSAHYMNLVVQSRGAIIVVENCGSYHEAEVSVCLHLAMGTNSSPAGPVKWCLSTLLTQWSYEGRAEWKHETLDTLEKWVTEIFSQIPNK
ncbi:UNVERIFIED_CONTAM: hypothetical protein K2H54_029380 [Gekko kuhli]